MQVFGIGLLTVAYAVVPALSVVLAGDRGHLVPDVVYLPFWLALTILAWRVAAQLRRQVRTPSMPLFARKVASVAAPRSLGGPIGAANVT